MAPSKSKKIIVKTDSPFTETTWPTISAEDQITILDLICNLLEPIGHHRRTHTQPSKGKSKKRKRNPNAPPQPDTKDSSPPPPELNNHILVGLNSLTRHLSAAAARTAPPTVPIAQLVAQKKQPDQSSEGRRDDHSEATPGAAETASARESTATGTTQSTPQPLSLLILPHPNPPSSLPHAHIPTLLYLSNLQSPSIPSPSQTQLVLLPSTSQPRLAAALDIPRCSALGILADAPGTETLVQFVREHVGRVECPWIEEAVGGEWRGVRTVGG